MEKRAVNAGRGVRREGERGFSLVEVMAAMMIGAVALTANLTMFNFAQKDFARSRMLTDATNIATTTLADFKTKSINEINLTTNLAAAGLKIGTHTESPALGNCTQLGGRTYCRSWEVWNVDIDSDGTADMVGDLVKVKLTVDWWIGPAAVASNRHSLKMATMTTGRPL